MTASLVRIGLVALVSAGALAAIPTAADAADPGSACLAGVQAASNVAVANRLTVLDQHTSEIAADTTIAAADRATLDGIYATDTAGLTALKGTIAAATSCPTARPEAMSIVTGYRVYVLVGPQTHEVEAADAGLAGATSLTGAEPALLLAIQVAQHAGKDVSGAQAAYADLTAKVTAAQGLLRPVPASVLALTPAGWPGDVTTVQADRQSVVTAGADLAAAAHDVSEISSDLG